MRKIISLACVAAMGISLAACATNPSTGPAPAPSPIPGQISDIVALVQKDANLICGFVPTFATIAAFVPGGIGAAVGDAASIATTVCNAIKSVPPVVVQSARGKSLRYGTKFGAPSDVQVASVMVPGVGRVVIAGTFTR